MKISTNWLQDILKFQNINLDDLKERLTLTGFEIEETIISKILDTNDIVLDLKTTTNRPDTINITGLSYEISCLFNLPFNTSKIKKKDFDLFRNNPQLLNVVGKNKHFKGTILYIAIIIENINFFKIQPWILKRLLSVNIEPKNNLYDLSSYLMLEWGQPFFIYDYDKIKKLTQNNNPKLSTRFAKDNEIFIDSTLKEYFLKKENLLILADNIPIGIAGSTISKDVIVDFNTKSLLIEASIFDQKVFRMSERVLGLRTEFSSQYEKGVNPYLTIPSFNRFLNLFFLSSKSELNFVTFNTFYKHTDISSVNKITLSYENISKVLGIQNQNNLILKKNIFYCLNKIKFKYIEEENFCHVFIPFTRLFDLEEEIDIIEEIARMIGFNNFPAILPKIYKISNNSNYQLNKKKFREIFSNLGFLELFNYSLTSTETKKHVRLLNPLNNEYSILRVSLIPQLLDSIERNLNKGNIFLPIFEIGRVFKNSNNKKGVFETDYISAIWGAYKYKNSWSDRTINVNWFQAKGFMEIIFSKLELPFIWSEGIPESIFYHPKNFLFIKIADQNVGLFGKIHPKTAEIKNLPKNCFLFELDLTKTIKLITDTKKLIIYKEYSLYPNLTIDISFLVPRKISFYEIENTIKMIADHIIEKIELFDFYEKIDNSKDYYSLSVKISFRSLNKTLTKIEIDPILVKIQNELNKKLNVIVRN